MTSQRLLVLGATGGTGRHIVRQALNEGHHVTAVSRHPGKLGIQHQRLKAVPADLGDDPSSAMRVVPGHDAVICALGRGAGLAGLTSENLMARATPGILAAM